MNMENTSIERISSIKKAQKEFFSSGATLDVKLKKSQSLPSAFLVQISPTNLTYIELVAKFVHL